MSTVLMVGSENSTPRLPLIGTTRLSTTAVLALILFHISPTTPSTCRDSRACFLLAQPSACTRGKRNVRLHNANEGFGQLERRASRQQFAFQVGKPTSWHSLLEAAALHRRRVSIDPADGLRLLLPPAHLWISPTMPSHRILWGSRPLHNHNSKHMERHGCCIGS